MVAGYFQEAASIMEELGLQGTAEYALLLEIQGCAWGMRGQPARALPFLQRAVDIARKVHPPDHPSLAAMLASFGTANEDMGRRGAAAAARAQALAIGRRSQTDCAGPGCVRKLREDGEPLDVCIKCRRTFYCGKACQTADWKREGGHKAECKALIAEAAAAAAAAAHDH